MAATYNRSGLLYNTSGWKYNMVQDDVTVASVTFTGCTVTGVTGQAPSAGTVTFTGCTASGLVTAAVTVAQVTFTAPAVSNGIGSAPTGAQVTFTGLTVTALLSGVPSAAQVTWTAPAANGAVFSVASAGQLTFTPVVPAVLLTGAPTRAEVTFTAPAVTFNVLYRPEPGVLTFSGGSIGVTATAPLPSSTWVNPFRASMTGDLGVVAKALDSLSASLRLPVFPQGFIIGNSTSPGVAPTALSAVGYFDVLPAPDVTAPIGVTNLTVRGGVKAVTAQWDALSDSTVYRYEVQVATSSGFATLTEQRFPGGNATVVSGLTFGTTYYVRVRAIDAAGNTGAWSSTVTGTPAQIDTPDMVVGSVTADVLASNSVIADKIQANAVVAGKIATDAVTTNTIAANSITTAKIQALQITGSLIAAGAVSADKIVANSIAAGQITVGGLTTATLADLAITEGKIAALAVAWEKIADNAIRPNTIQADAVTSGKIAADAVTAREIVANTITAAEIAADTITAAQIATDTITASEIAAGTITGSEIGAVTLTVGTYIHSSNYVNGSTGWAIDSDGNAEFNDVTIRGSLVVNGEFDGGELTGGRFQSPDFDPMNPHAAGWGIDYLGGAYFNEGFFQGKVAAGSITSNVYSAGTAGWTIDADGNAEFNDVTVRGTVAASTVSGSQIYGSSFVLTSGYSGQRVEMLSSTPNQISFYTGDTSGDLGYLKVTSDYLELASPVDSGSVAHIYMYSSGDDPSYGDTHIVMDANYVSAGTFVADNYLNSGSYQGATTGAAGALKCISANVITFNWDGTNISAYIDGTYIGIIV